MNPEPHEPQPPPSDSQTPVYWPTVVAVLLGGLIGFLHLISRSREAPHALTHPVANAVGQIGVFAAPVFLGILAGVVWPAKPYLRALLLSLCCLLIGAPLMGEGAICLIIAIPIAVLTTLLSALCASAIARRSGRASYLLLVLPFAASEYERLHPTPLPQPETIADSVIVPASPAQVWRSIEMLDIRFLKPAPWITRIGAPAPHALQGGGAFVGAERRVLFGNGVVLATVIKALPEERFDIRLSVEKSGREFFDHWMVLGDSSFMLAPLPGGRTRLTHVTTYRPLSSPRWYFRPVERFLGHAIQRYMLEAYAEQHFDAARPLVRPAPAPHIALR